MPPRGWLKSPARVAIVLLGGTALSVAAVLWMAWRLLDQDSALERQQAGQRLEAAADAAAAVLDRALLQTAQAMASDTWRPAGSNAVLIRARHSSLTVIPSGTLLFLPAPSRPKEPDPALFTAAEREEFVNKNWDKAAGVYRGLAASPDPAIRAAALVRLARVQKASGDRGAALETYARLARLDHAFFEGVPVRLLALLARGEAVRLGRALDHPDELPSRDVFLFHAEQAEMLSQGAWKRDSRRFVFSDAISAAWPESDGSGRVVQDSVTILWTRAGASVTLLAAGMEFARNEWLTAASGLVRQAGAELEIGGSAKSGAVIRPPSATGLPWPISLRQMNEPGMPLFAGHRRLLAVGALALSAMLLLAGYLGWRAVARELAAARMQADFVAAVSHEFRTPLTSLGQFTGMLLDRDSLSDAQRRTCYEAQARSTERLSRLVESLLDFRRMEAGARPYTMERIDAAEFVRGVAGEFARESGAGVRVDVPAECPVLADAGALSIAVWNLLDNAVKYSQGDEPVDVQVRHEDQNVSIRVTDHGAGIPPSEQRRIFDRFVRGAEARKLGIKGTGIGLAMVKHVAEAHHGRVELQSHPGRGSTFTIVLPALEK